jgi:hypothetical protein
MQARVHRLDWGVDPMKRIAAVIAVLGMWVAPVPAQQRFAYADLIEDALIGCHDGQHAIVDAEVEHQALWFRAGPREVRVFFGSVGVDYAQQGSAGRSYRPEARLTLTCVNTLACAWSGPWDAELAAARAQHGIVLLSALQMSNQATVLHCPDLAKAKALHRALQAFQRASSSSP